MVRGARRHVPLPVSADDPMELEAYETIIVESHGPVGVLTLNRPEKGNSVTRRMCREAMEVLERMVEDTELAVLILSGSGDQIFCSGTDLNEIRQARDAGDETLTQEVVALHAKVAAFPKPLIAAVNGKAFGGGALFAINCDLRIVADSASFAFVGTKLGIVTGASRLPAIVGAPKAKELIFTGRPIGAAEALSMGLANQVVRFQSLREAALEMANSIAANSLVALCYAKEVIDLATMESAAVEREEAIARQLLGNRESDKRLRGRIDEVVRKKSP